MALELQQILRGSTRAAVEADLQIGEPGLNEESTRLELIIEKAAGGAWLHWPSEERLDDITASASGASLIGVEDDAFSVLTGDGDLQTLLKALDTFLNDLTDAGNAILKNGTVNMEADWIIEENLTIQKELILSGELDVGGGAVDTASATPDNVSGYSVVKTNPTSGQVGYSFTGQVAYQELWVYNTNASFTALIANGSPGDGRDIPIKPMEGIKMIYTSSDGWILFGVSAGDMIGPGPTVADETVPVFDGTGGYTLKNTDVKIIANDMSGIFDLSMTGDQTITSGGLQIATTNEKIEFGTAIDMYYDGSSLVVACGVNNISITTSDIVVSDGNGDKPMFWLINQNENAQGSFIRFQKESASAANDDELGQIGFYGYDNVSATQNFGSISLYSEDITSGLSLKGRLEMSVKDGTGSVCVFKIRGEGVDIKGGTTGVDPYIRLEGDASSTYFQQMEDEGECRISNAASASNYLALLSDGSPLFVGTAGLTHGELYSQDTATTVTISSSGKVNKVKVPFASEGSFKNMSLDATTDEDITVDKAGKYLCLVSLSAYSDTGGGFLSGWSIWKNDGATEFANVHTHRNLSGGGSDQGAMSLSGIIDLAVNDTIELWCWNETNTTNIIVDDVTMTLIQISGT